MNKQKTDWERKLMTLMIITIADALFAGRSRPITKDCSDVTVKHHKKISKFISQLLKTQREEIIKEIEGIVGEDEKIELEQPKLFLPNPEPNEYGGYSSVPFYCSLCGESEMTIQDNEVNGKYHCKCSWWTNSCGGKWIKWYDKDYAEKAILDIPSEDNIRNQLRKEIRERLKQITN